MAIELDNEKIMAAVVDKIADDFLSNEAEISDRVAKKINAQIDAIFLKKVEPRINAELDRALGDCFHREFQKTTAWGERDGETTTISKELEKLMSGYWAEKVNEAGKPCNYGKMTRAEYTMAKVTGEDFKDQMHRYLVQGAAALKDGLRAQMRGQIDEMIGKLFRVQTAQDQAEGRYV